MKETTTLSAFSPVIRQARKSAGISQKELAQLLQVTRNTVINWESGRCLPDTKMLQELCRILHIPVSDLFPRDDPEVLSAQERQLLGHFRGLSPEGQTAAVRILHVLLEEEQHSRDAYYREHYRIFADWPGTVAAGTGSLFSEEQPSPVFLRISDQSSRADAVIRVCGNSMEPVYHDGDYVYFRYADSAVSGEDVICSTADGAVMKRVSPDNTLYSVNPEVPYGAKTEDAHVTILGVVTGIVASTDRPDPADADILADLFSEELRQFRNTYTKQKK